jgi:hypothetical protein
MDEDRPVTDLDSRPDELRHYVASMRRQRRWYLAVVAAVVAVGVAVFLTVWFTGEVTHVHMRTAASPPPPVPTGTPAAQPTLRWRSGDATAIGKPFSGGTVVTYSRHTVTGRNALTGAADWSYTRTDRSVCQVVQGQNSTVAIYDNGGNCDQVTALDTGTGKRAWTRTLDENGMPVAGHPTVLAASDAFFVTTATVIYAIPLSDSPCNADTGGGCGGDVWTFHPDNGCLIGTIAPGTSGVLIQERCASGSRLLLRDRYKGDDDKQNSDDKKRQILWRIGNSDAVPLAADAAVVALDPGSHDLIHYDATNGKVAGRTPLDPAPSASEPVSRVSLSDADLVWLDGYTYALTAGAQQWSARTTGPPTVDATEGVDSTPALGSAHIVAPTSSGVAVLDSGTGTIAAGYRVSPPAPGSQVFSLGTGFLVAGPTTTVYQ